MRPRGFMGALSAVLQVASLTGSDSPRVILQSNDEAQARSDLAQLSPSGPTRAQFEAFAKQAFRYRHNPDRVVMFRDVDGEMKLPGDLSPEGVARIRSQWEQNIREHGLLKQVKA